MSMPQTPSKLAPGMASVIRAGETWEIEDANRQTFEIKAVEHDDTMAFLKMFDEWLTMKNASIGGVVIEAQWGNVVQAFNNLPMHIQRELPSMKSIGVRLAQGHQH